MYGSHIKFNFSHSVNAVVTINADNKNDAVIAVELLTMKMQYSQRKWKLLVDNHVFAVLVGKKGNKIKDIRKSSKAGVKAYDQYAPSSDERVIMITGFDRPRKTALSTIMDVVSYHSTPATIRLYTPHPATDFAITAPELWGGQLKTYSYTDRQQQPPIERIPQTLITTRQKPIVYVFGASHIMRRNGCNLNQRLHNLPQTEVKYITEDGGRFVHLHHDITKASNIATKHDIILVEIGRASCRERV